MRPRTLVTVGTALAALALPATDLFAQARRRGRGRTQATPTATAVAPSGPRTAVALGVAGDHSCVVTSDHRAFCWGEDAIIGLLSPRSSVLGRRDVPTLLAGSDGASDLFMQGSQVVLRVGEGRLDSYGTWDITALGGRTTHSPEDWATEHLVREGVDPARRPIASASGAVLCAIEHGRLRCRGANQFGQLGARVARDASEPLLDVAGLRDVRGASSGGDTTCAIDAGGLACWGRGADYARGDGSVENARTPVRIQLASTPTDVAVSRGGHGCVLTDAGEVFCWGRGREGQLGVGSLDAAERPARVDGVSGASAIAVGRYHSCAIAGSEGAVWCWGAGSHGQLGDGRAVGSSVPVRVSGLAHVTRIALGDAHGCAIDTSGQVWCWGRNEYGNCGMSAGTDQTVPAHVALP
ncbi:MAG: hypothetical protein WCJ30_20880 [Deltaproteobacteria bacterium]